MTLSPIFQPPTADPTAAISPAPSVTGMMGKRLSGYLPVATAISRKLREAARSRSNTSWGPGVGSSQVMPRKASSRGAFSSMTFIWPV